MRAWVLLLLVGCDPPPKPVAPVAEFPLAVKVTTPATGAVQEGEWSVSASEFADPARRREPRSFVPTRELRVVGLRSPKHAQTLTFIIAGDGTRFAVLKGGVPFHELASADEAKAIEEALKFLRVQAGREFYGNP